MKRLLERSGFTLLTTQLLPESERRGNSLLIVAGLTGCIHQPDASANPTHLEKMDDWTHYEGFGKAVDASYARMREHVRTIRRAGGRVAAYGAGGRGVMTLAMSGLDHADIEFVCDKNEGFRGLLTPKTHIPVVSPQHLLANPVDEVIVFSFGYLAEIRDELADYLHGGGKLVSLLDVLKS